VLIWVLFFGGNVIAASTTSANQISTKQDDVASERVVEEILVDGRAVLQRVNSASEVIGFYAKTELPTLKGGNKYRAKITIANPYSEAIDFSTITMSCGCGKLTGSVREIPALGESTFVLQLDVPTILQRTAAQSVFFHSVEDPSKVVMTLRYSFDVSNVFAFSQPRIEIEIPEKQENVNVRIPFYIVPPITLDQLELSWSENLNGINFRIVEDDTSSDQPYVIVEAAPGLISRQGVFGDLILRHRDTGVKSQVEIHMSHQELLTLAPQIIEINIPEMISTNTRIMVQMVFIERVTWRCCFGWQINLCRPSGPFQKS
jgi:hypothetical protein